MEKFFKLKENGTSVSTEIMAGLTTFFAMSYICLLYTSPVPPSTPTFNFSLIPLSPLFPAQFSSMYLRFTAITCFIASCPGAPMVRRFSTQVFKLTAS